MTMEAAGTHSPARARLRRPRASTVLVVLVSWLFLTLVSLKLTAGGHIRPDLVAILSGEIWREGGWLSHLTLHLVGLLPGGLPRELSLNLITATAAAIAIGVLYHKMRLNGWTVLGVWVALGATIFHSEVLYSITSETRYLPVFVGIALIVPAVRHIEEVGDVQAAISLSLLLPVLLLAGPITSLFIMPLALGVTLADGDARKDPRAFVAMFLVAILPTIIVIIGALGFMLQAGIDTRFAILPYVALYSSLRPPDFIGAMSVLSTFAPIGIVPVLYCLWPNLPQRPRYFSALSVALVPVCLALIRDVLATDMPSFVPSVALISAFFAWLGQVRLPVALRAFTVLLLLISAALSWVFGGYGTEPEWAAALLNDIPGTIGRLTLRPGV